MEGPMKKTRIPKTDSVQELARFWDKHDLTDFEDELVEVTEPVFVLRNSIQVRLESRQAAAIKKIAMAEGISEEELVRRWVVKQIQPRNGNAKEKRLLGKTQK